MSKHVWLWLSPHESVQHNSGKDYHATHGQAGPDSSSSRALDDVIIADGDCSPDCCIGCKCGCQADAMHIDPEQIPRGYHFHQLDAVEALARNIASLSSIDSDVPTFSTNSDSLPRNGPFVAPSLRFLYESEVNRTSVEASHARVEDFMRRRIDEDPFSFFISRPEYEDDANDDGEMFGPPEMSDSMDVNVELSNSQFSRLSEYSSCFQRSSSHNNLIGIGGAVADADNILEMSM